MRYAAAPTIFVGLGGTGITILRRFRERLEHRWGAEPIPQFRYLFVDTDVNALSSVTKSLREDEKPFVVTNVVSPSRETLERLQSSTVDGGTLKKHLLIDDWFDATALAQLDPVGFSQGVGGRRMYSRLAFLASDNARALEASLVQFHDDLCKKISDDKETLRVVVLNSSGGGTGSGAFIDFGFFVRELAKRNNWTKPDLYLHSITALARGGSNVATLQQQRNTAGLLTELDYYDGSRLYTARYVTAPHNEPPRRLQTRPYDRSYLVQATQQSTPLDGSPEKSLDLMLWKLADYLLATSFTVYEEKVAQPLLSGTGAAGLTAWRKDADAQNPQGAYTLGISMREWPARLVASRIASNLLAKVAADWTEPSRSLIGPQLAMLRNTLGLPDDIIRSNRSARNPEMDGLLHLLLREVDEVDVLRRLKRCESKAYDEKGSYQKKQLVQVANAIKSELTPREGRPGDAVGGESYAVVHTNARALLAEQGKDSLRLQVADTLLGLCRTQGPAFAAAAARAVQGDLAHELEFIAEARKTLSPTLPESPVRLEQCWQYANERLLELLLERKAAVYQQLGPWLDKLTRRLDYMTRYLTDWAHDRAARQVNLESRSPSIVLPQAEMDRLSKVVLQGSDLDFSAINDLVRALRLEVDKGLPEVDGKGQPTLFASGPPTQAGRPDYSHLAGLEEAIMRAVERSTQANPYHERVLELLLKHDGALPPFLKEAELLINFRPSNEYNAARFGGKSLYVVRSFQKDQPETPKLDMQDQAHDAWFGNWKNTGMHEKVDEHDKLTPELNPWVVSYIAERCSIQTDLIVGYSRDERIQLLEGSHVNDFSALSNKQVRLKVDPKVQAEARELLLGSIALRRWTYLGDKGHRFTFEDDIQGLVKHASFEVSTHLQTACEQLESTARVRHFLSEDVTRYIKSSPGEATSLLFKAIEEMNVTSSEARYSKTLQLDGVSFPDATDTLYNFAKRYSDLIKLPPKPHPFARLVTKGSPLGDATDLAPQDGYYCQGCNHSLGIEEPPRSGSCKACGKTGVR